MPGSRTLPCAGCGVLLWRGRTSLPEGEATCQPCRRVRSDAFLDALLAGGVLPAVSGAAAAGLQQRVRVRALEVFVPGTPCPRCALPMEAGQVLDLDHRDDRTAYLGLAHRRCNRAASPTTFQPGGAGRSKPRKTSDRGYGWEHQKVRAEYMDALRDGDPCARCQEPMRVSEPVDLDHAADGGYLGLSHRACNRAAHAAAKQTECPVCGARKANRSATCGARPCIAEWRQRDAVA